MIDNFPTSRPVLAIDFDDTLVFHAENVVKHYNETHNGHITLADTYVAEKFGNPRHGWNHNRAEALEWIKVYLHTESALTTPPVKDALAVLERLKERYKLHVVSGRDPSWDTATQPWLDQFMPGIFTDVHYAGDTRKSVVCHQIGATAIVDDSPVYLADCVAAGIHGIVFGDYPWNNDERLPAGVTRASNWLAVEEALRK